MNAPTPTNALAEPFVLRSDADGVATLTLNRGDRFNPLSSGMIAALIEALDAIGPDANIRAVVIAAKGRGFCAGHDLKELRAHPDEAWQRGLFKACGELMLKIVRLPQPVIARVHGIATAAGCQLTATCDLAVAADDARFALPGVNIGLFCSTPAVGVGRNLNRKRTMEMLLTGDMVDAPTALDWGLINRAVPAAQLDAEIAKFTDAIKSKSAASVALGKEVFYRQMDMDLPHALALAGETMTCNMMLDDAAEGIDAFIGKRAPQWKGR
ncbi:MAG: Enoyl-CoA hydratase [Betaproteobacteria bacterium]|nr:Enoyl-CoA hydratase [Betaproteobacteria bacterium]